MFGQPFFPHDRIIIITAHCWLTHDLPPAGCFVSSRGIPKFSNHRHCLFKRIYMIYSSNDNLYLDETSCQMGLTGACHIDHWDIPYTMCRLGCTWTKCGSAQPCCWILATVTDPLNSSIEIYSLLV